MHKKVKKILIYFGGFILLIVGGTVGMIEFTNRPDFCRSCHYMEPYYDAWKESSHKDVSCDLCHYTPGYENMIMGKIHDINQLVKYATNAYRKSKPWAEIDDASCLREGCHDTRLLQGEVMFGNVKFDHGPHLSELRRGRKLRCTSCHSQIVQGEHMTVTASTCVLCHFKETEKHEGEMDTDDCRLCHDPSVEPKSITEQGYDHTKILADSLDCRRCHGNMLVGDGAVNDKGCYFCHWDQDRLSKFNDSELMHRKHITENKIECEQCHSPMEHKWTTPENAAEHCGGCHQGMHQNQLKLFSGEGGIGVKNHPNPMYNISMSCQGCHVQHATETMPNGGTTFIAGENSCEPCHGKGYDRLLVQWNKTIKNKVQYLSKLMNKVENSYDKSSKSNFSEVIPLIKNARTNLDIVRYGKPVHNIVYSNELLFSSFDDLSKAGKKLEIFVDPTTLFSQKQMVPSDCKNCHATIDNITVELPNRSFEHGLHLKAGKECADCHTHQRRHGQTFKFVKDCQSCHHQKATAGDCNRCHELQAKAYNGGKFNGFVFETSVMAEAEISCEECHTSEDEKIVRPHMQSCENCHESEYVDIGDNWQAEVKDKIDELEIVIELAKELPLNKLQSNNFNKDLKSFKKIKKDKSYGIHNNEEYIRIMDEMIQKYKNLESGS